MGLLPLNYRRPPHVKRPSTTSSEHSSFSNASKSSSGIPPALSFDKIIEGGTCPPCTIRDFMNYLIYIERSAENLQFHLWYRDYVSRFASAPESETALAPIWTPRQEEEVLSKMAKETVVALRRDDSSTASIFRGTDFEKPGLKDTVFADDAFSTPPRTPQTTAGDRSIAPSEAGTAAPWSDAAAAAFLAAGAKLPFTIQPFRAEIDRVIATYIADRAPRQLNMSSKEQRALLHALSRTTHPSAFRSVAAGVESGLRHQAHPNFIRWSICNGNPARVTFARGLGVGTIVLSTALAIALTLSRAARGYRALAAVGWVVGVATLVAAGKGMCVVLHGMHHRHVRPWELFVAEDEEGEEKEGRGGSFESFGSGNSYEEEPWVVRYERRNVVRKVFDREVWIQEPVLRRIQDTIFVQSLVCGVLVAGVLTGVFVGVPGGGMF